jgi:putative inorganic carbon (HCO3(-)) transporter
MSGLRTAVQRAAVFVDHWQWLVLLLAAPLLLFPTPARSPSLLVVPGLWIIAGLAGKGCLPRTPLNVSLLVLSVMVLISLYATYDIAVSLPSIANIVLGFGTYFVVVRRARQPRGWWRSGVAFIGIGLAIAGLSLFSTQWLSKIQLLAPLIAHLPKIVLPGRETGLQPNIVAGTLIWFIPLLATATIWSLSNVRNAIRVRDHRAILLTAVAGLGALFILGVFVLTQSRTGYLALAVATALIGLMALARRWRRFALLGTLTVVTAFGVILACYGFSANQSDDTALSLDTLEGRVEVWSRALDGIQDFPLTGTGLNTFGPIVRTLYPLFLIGPDAEINHAHNEYLQVAFELGVPGLIGFLALYISAFGMLRRIWQRVTPAAKMGPIAIRALVLGLTGGLLGHMMFGLTDAVILSSKPSFLFWMLLGLIAGLFLQTRPYGDMVGIVDRDAMHTKETG